MSPSRAVNPIYKVVPLHIQSSASPMYPHRAVPPHMDTIAPPMSPSSCGAGRGPGQVLQLREASHRGGIGLIQA